MRTRNIRPIITACAAIIATPLVLPVSCAIAGAEDPLARGIGADVTATPGSVWTIEDGLLIPERGEDRTYIVTKKRYADAEITLEFNPDPGTNSGVFARCQDPASITPNNCYEFNIWDAHPQQEARTGAIVTIAPPTAPIATEGRWNTMRVRLEGARLSVWVNGTLTNDVEHDKLANGHIALQYGGEGGMVKFRNLRIEALK